MANGLIPEEEQFQGLLAGIPRQGPKWADALQYIGAGLRDIGGNGSGNLAAVQQQFAGINAQRAGVQQQIADMRMRNARADALGLTGQMRDLYINSPEDYAKLAVSNLENYTLSPGQRRYNAGTGEATVAPEFREMGDQLVRIDDAGPQGVFRRDPTIAEQETARRNLATEGLTARGQDIMMRGQNLSHQAAMQRSPSENDRQIAALMERGLPRQRAEDIVYGNEQVRVDPVTGNQYVVNAVDGTARMVDYAESQTTPSAEVAGTRTLWDNTAGVAGVASAGQDLMARTLGQIPGVNIGDEARQAVANRQLYNNAMGDMVRALAQNPRLPVAEMERIREEVNIAPRAFDSQEALQTRMIEVDGYLQRRQANMERESQDRSLPVDVRQDAAANAVAIRNFRSQLGVPSGARSGAQSSPPAGDFSNASDDDLLRILTGQ